MKREIPDIALTLTPGIGPKGAVHLLDVFGSAEAVFSASADELIEKARLRPELARAILQKKAFADAEREVKHCRKHGIEIIASTDAQYPALLRETADYPHVLYVLGSPEALGKTTLTMVGTRRMTPYGQQMADRLIGELADRVADTVIVSGLAFGIDTACHRAALAFGMPTVGIIASALPGITPAQHTAVARDMIEHGGAVVSELHSQTRQNGNFYHSRNRLLAGISGGTVVVESPAEGGSMDTARLADGYNRMLMAVPGRATDFASAGTNLLIRTQRAQMVCTGEDIVREMMWDQNRPGDLIDRPTATHARRRGAAGLLPHRRPDIRRRALRTLGARIRRTFGPAAGTRNGRSRPTAPGEPIYETDLIHVPVGNSLSNSCGKRFSDASRRGTAVKIDIRRENHYLYPAKFTDNMAIPKFDAIRIQALKLLGNGQTLKPKDFFQPLAEQFRLDENDKNAMYPSGNGYIFYDRISWALSYLYLAQLVDKPQRGLYRINPQGLKMLSEHTPEEINDYVEQTVQARTPRKSRRAGTTTEALALSDTPSGELTPQEALEQSFDNIRKSVYAEILETIIGKSPRAFERLVVQLLQAMGYGGEVKGSGQVTRASKDGGIDGIIKEDILGFGRIYIQAKRYGLNYAVQRDEVQKFVGALAVAQSHKGVFITTSYFTSGAIDYVKGLNGAATIVLIDGKQLAEYIYDFRLGMQSVKTIHIKKPDNDFWDAMEDDDKKTTA